ncbi:MAG: hypothetical protein LZ172_07395 [Thaumarchaeota archaeon]|jgi:5-methyltetrahydropteroyltriglutamate--homocysteine methyltransferase|nr:hypothetical protein [Candidatus Geocrenenecus arthurdayi]MCL7404151.1 hypothetical protein [Candidatus Geocrenenecus arthurdayi]
MTEVYGVLVGAYSRSEYLIKSFREYFKGKLERDELRKRILEEARKIVELQDEAGLRYIIDGMLEWHDLLRPIAENLLGVEVDGLARWFDNNAFYKKPIITGEIHRKNSILSGYIYPDLVTMGRWKLILPDPYTFISLSENKSKLKLDDLLFQYSEALNHELLELQRKYKIGQVQLSAPSLVWSKLGGDVLEIVGDAIAEMFKGVTAEKMVYLYFGDGLNALPAVLDYDLDVVGFDLTYTSLNMLADYDIDRIALGIVDGRNSLLEDVETILKKIDRYMDKREPEILYITPSCELEFIPIEVANEKVKLISRIVRKVGGRS